MRIAIGSHLPVGGFPVITNGLEGDLCRVTQTKTADQTAMTLT